MLSHICLGDSYWWSGYPCVFCHLDLTDLTCFSILSVPPPFSGPVYNRVARMFPSSLVFEANANKFKPVLYPFKPRSIPI